MAANVLAVHGQALRGAAFGVIIVRRVLRMVDIVGALTAAMIKRPI